MPAYDLDDQLSWRLSTLDISKVFKISNTWSVKMNRYAHVLKVRSCTVRSCTVRSCTVRSCTVRSCTVRSCTVRSCTVRSCTVRSCTVRSEHVLLRGVKGTDIRSLSCLEAISLKILRRVHTRDPADRASVDEKTCLTCKYDPAGTEIRSLCYLKLQAN